MKDDLSLQFADLQPDLYRIKCELSQKYLGVSPRSRKLRRSKLSHEFSSKLVGVGVAEKKTNRCNSGRWGVTFYVKRKLRKTSLSRKLMLPSSYQGIPCDVIECRTARPATAYPSYSSVNDPLRPGCQIGVVGDNANHKGTLGGFMQGPDRARYLISNCHVLSPDDLASKGKIVYQPAPGVPGSRPIGVVTHVIPLLEVNDVDLAVARINEEVAIDPSNYWGPVPGTGPLEARERVRKYGAGNGNQTGRCKALYTDIGWEINGKHHSFRNLQGFTPRLFATKGDSGSLVALRKNNTWVSMIIGVTKRNIDCGIPINIVEKKLSDYTWI